MSAPSVVRYVGIVFGLTWALNALLLALGGLAAPGAFLFLVAQMFVPGAVAVALVAREHGFRAVPAKLGLRLGRGAWVYLFAWFAFPLFSLAAPFVGAAFGVYALDVQGFSGFRELVEEAGGAAAFTTMTPATLVAIQVVATFFSPAINAPATLGEELGWRGWLLPALRPLGPWRALVVSGAIWGLWHAPIVMMGHNYPGRPLAGVALMVAFCVLFGILLGWTRLRTGSVWPAVLAHAGINGSAGVVSLFHRAGTEPDPTLVGLTGITGWILPALAVVGLVVAGRLPVREAGAAPPDAP